MGVPYRRITHLRKHLALEFVEAGHILGSASVDLRITEGVNHRIVFSGDIGRSGLPIIRDPEPPSGPVDTLIVESTYADRDHESVAGAEDRLGEAVRRTAARGGKVLIPAFALGRVQELVYALHALHRAGRIPDVPIYIDSPLAVDTTTVFRMHPEVFDEREQLVADNVAMFDFSAAAVHAERGGVEGAERAARSGDHHRRERHGGVGPHPAPPGARYRRPPQPGALRRLPGGAHARPPDPERRGGRAHPRPGLSRAAPRSRPSAATRPTPTATSSGPGCADWAAPSGAPSWCTARPRPSAPWRRSSARRASARCILPKHGEAFDL